MDLCSERVARAMAIIQQHMITIRFVPSTLNAADILTRSEDMGDQKGIQNNIFTKVCIFNSEGKQIPNASLFSKEKQQELNHYFETNKRTPLAKVHLLKERKPIFNASSGRARKTLRRRLNRIRPDEVRQTPREAKKMKEQYKTNTWQLKRSTDSHKTDMTNSRNLCHKSTEPTGNETRAITRGAVPAVGGQAELELTSQNRLGKNPLIWNEIQHVAQKSSNDTDLNQQISGEIFLGPKDRALTRKVCTRKGVPRVLWNATRSANRVDSIVERILTEADVTTVLDRQSCALGTVTICNKSPHSGWPMENIPPEHQTTTTSLISQSRCTLKPLMRRQREVLTNQVQ
jgi:hypothetical protein